MNGPVLSNSLPEDPGPGLGEPVGRATQVERLLHQLGGEVGASRLLSALVQNNLLAPMVVPNGGAASDCLREVLQKTSRLCPDLAAAGLSPLLAVRSLGPGLFDFRPQLAPDRARPNSGSATEEALARIVQRAKDAGLRLIQSAPPDSEQWRAFDELIADTLSAVQPGPISIGDVNRLRSCFAVQAGAAQASEGTLVELSPLGQAIEERVSEWRERCTAKLLAVLAGRGIRALADFAQSHNCQAEERGAACSDAQAGGAVDVNTSEVMRRDVVSCLSFAEGAQLFPVKTAGVTIFVDGQIDDHLYPRLVHELVEPLVVNYLLAENERHLFVSPSKLQELVELDVTETLTQAVLAVSADKLGFSEEEVHCQRGLAYQQFFGQFVKTRPRVLEKDGRKIEFESPFLSSIALRLRGSHQFGREYMTYLGLFRATLLEPLAARRSRSALEVIETSIEQYHRRHGSLKGVELDPALRSHIAPMFARFMARVQQRSDLRGSILADPDGFLRNQGLRL
jgi:hypothetical protein